MRSVSSLQNDTVKLVRSLDMRKVRRETNLFTAEGTSVLITAKDHGRLPKILIVRAGTDIAPVLSLVDAVAAAGGDVIEATDQVMEKITTKDNPQAVVGVFEQVWCELPSSAPLATEGDAATTWVALEHIRDPGNLGTIIRTADAAGAAGVILIGTCCDVHARECVRATMGSIFAVPIVRVDDAAAHAIVADWPGDRVGTHLSGTQDFRTRNYRSPTLLVMGSEGPGLSDGLARACNALVKIPMAGRLDSLNLAIATALVLYAIRGPALEL